MLGYVCTLQVLANPSTDMQEGSAVSLGDLQDQGVRPYDEKARWLTFIRWIVLHRGSITACLLVPAHVAKRVTLRMIYFRYLRVCCCDWE